MTFRFSTHPCPRCHGTRKVGRGQCYTCEGTGRLRTTEAQRAAVRLRTFLQTHAERDAATIVRYVGPGLTVTP